MRSINKIKIYTNNNEKSSVVKDELIKVLLEYEFDVVEKNYDLAIAIGGDGAFLRMVKSNNFNSNVYYVGINTGTLGFLQEIKPYEVHEFVEHLNNNNFKIDEIGVLETHVTTSDKHFHHYSLNEVVVREENLDALSLDIVIDSFKLERFMGDGMLISTSVGSTAYNTSFNGAIVYNTLHTLQLTPIAPINSKVYRSLCNSIVLPEDKSIKLVPYKKNLLLIYDGENYHYKNVVDIECSVKDKKLKFLRMNEYNFIDIINNKFLSD